MIQRRPSVACITLVAIVACGDGPASEQDTGKPWLHAGEGKAPSQRTADARPDGDTAPEPTAGKPANTVAGEGAAPPRESALVEETVTKFRIPGLLAGVRLGMTVAEFRAARNASAMKSHAYHESIIPKISDDQTDEELFAALDEAEKNRKKVESPEWPGTEGLYYLDETFAKGALRKATFQFSEGRLYEVIAYYPTTDEAAAVAKQLWGTAPNAEGRWKADQNGDTPPITAWVYKDRYVVKLEDPTSSK